MSSVLGISVPPITALNSSQKATAASPVMDSTTNAEILVILLFFAIFE